MIISYLCLLLAILSTALGQFFYKKFTIQKKKKYFIFTILLFLVTPVFSFIALKHLSIDVVYMSTALTIFFVVMLSKIFLNEYIPKRVYLGVFLICLGVICYGL